MFPSHEILIGFYMFLLVSNGVPTRQWDRPRVVSPIFSLLKLVGFPNWHNMFFYLVVEPYPLWKMWKRVSWDDFSIPNWMESHNPFMFQTTNQLCCGEILEDMFWWCELAAYMAQFVRWFMVIYLFQMVIFHSYDRLPEGIRGKQLKTVI